MATLPADSKMTFSNLLRMSNKTLYLIQWSMPLIFLNLSSDSFNTQNSILSYKDDQPLCWDCIHLHTNWFRYSTHNLLENRWFIYFLKMWFPFMTQMIITLYRFSLLSTDCQGKRVEWFLTAFSTVGNSEFFSPFDWLSPNEREPTLSYYLTQ